MLSYDLSSIYFKRKKMAEAEQLIRATMSMPHKSNLMVDSLWPYFGLKLAQIYYWQANYQEAIKVLDNVSKSLPLKDNANQILFLIISNIWIDMPEPYQPGGYYKGLHYLNIAENLLKKDGDPDNNLGIIYNNEGTH
jgi:tetratricopeptide (TPR) repeat protein